MMKGSSFGYLVKEGARNIYANRLMSLASIGVLVACLLLIGAAALFSLNVNKAVGVMEAQNEVVVFLNDDIDDTAIAEIDKSLRANSNVFDVAFITREQGLTELLGTMGEDGVLLEDFYDDNPLPNSYRIKIKDLSILQQTVDEVAAIYGVEKVNAQFEVASTLTGIKHGVYIGGSAIVLILATVSLIIIGNTIKITVFNRRKEINIMKFVGATDSFIRLPFFIEGLILGLLSASVAYFILWGAYSYAFNAAAVGDASTWLNLLLSNMIRFDDVALQLFLGFVATGVVVGVGGSMVFVRKHLKV